ncbi:MAG TPA: radical SAM protein [Bacillota bacterium]|nr:radical SAM protein [Bacillota bacterium]HPL98376.1 radical SAM protein [Bacillota bacterium]HPW40189.1 radical SAM protein [Bacillota bacterium]
MSIPKIIRSTYSVCPVCLSRIPAQHVEIGSNVYLQKKCVQHGFFSSVIWRSKTPIGEWIGDTPRIKKNENLNCPKACGICPEHRQGTCCVLLEVTSRCNLRCKYCFADSRNTDDPSLEQVQAWLRQLAVPGKTLVQLSGGEPTVRDDLPEIISSAKEAGCRYVQLNSNGIRLAEDKEFVRKLAEAGLSFVFMQFDGTNDEINRKLRGVDLLALKKQAIENCAAYNIGVTLVPTMVPGVNTDNIGELLRFAIAESPAVRGVHFQPVSYFGRIPERPVDEVRYTLDELIYDIEVQTKGQIKAKNLIPSRCDHPLCGFHGDFVVMPHGIEPLSGKYTSKGDCCGSEPVSADKNRAFVARRWERQVQEQESHSCCSKPDIHDMDYFLKRVKSHGFTITAMAFQDAGNMDLERLRRCSLHVFDNGRFVPFCAYYLTGWDMT